MFIYQGIAKKKLSFVSQAACEKYMLVLDVCTTAFCIQNIHSWWVLMKLFMNIFFPRSALVHKPCPLMDFLLILKESHGGKNLSYITNITCCCFWFLKFKT